MKKPNSILVIQVGSEAAHVVAGFFDQNDLSLYRDYLFFEDFSQEVFMQLTPEVPQLVFTSHAQGVNAHEVASYVKEVNREAIVIALTSVEVPDCEDSHLDGVLTKPMASPKPPAEVAKAFLAGASRTEIIRLVESFKKV
ncbi:MAG: hypothetical protein V4481_04685 [Patescibacteria group bacterium]